MTPRWRALLDAISILRQARETAGNGIFTTSAETILDHAMNYARKEIAEIRAH